MKNLKKYVATKVLKSMTKPQLITKLIRDTTVKQKEKMLRLVLKRMTKAGLIKLCMVVGKSNLTKLTTSKGMLRKSSRKAYKFPKKRRTTTRRLPRWGSGKRTSSRTTKRRKPRRLVKGSPEAKRYMAKIRRMRR